MEIENDILNLVLHFTAFGTLLCGWLLFMRRKYGDRSRTMLAWCFTLCGIAVLVRVLMGYRGWPVSDEVLLPSDLNSGLFTILLFFLYPIEVIRPGWLSAKKMLVMALPWIMFNAILLFTPDIRHLDSFSQISVYAGEFNVWIRLVILALFIPMCFVLLGIPHNWARSSADNRWIMLYTVGTQGIAVLYLFSMLTGYTLVNALHIAYCMALCLAVTYQELYLRIMVPAGSVPKTDIVSVSPEPEASEADSFPLWRELNRLMEEEELWRNPDLTLENVAKQLGSNRTTIANLIRRHGYDDYRHFINRRRIAEFLKIAATDRRINIQDTFFNVGFRSKNTALRYFRKLTGTIPSEYLQNLHPDE